MPHTVTRATDSAAQARAVDGRTACRETVPRCSPPAVDSPEAPMTARPSTDAADCR